MNSRTLKYFEVVARVESIRGASEVLCIAPSAISKKISCLEDSLGVKLLNRVGVRGVRVSDAGEKLLKYIETVRIQEEALLADIGTSNTSESRVLRIATGGGFTSDLVTNGIRRFSQANPCAKYMVKICSGSGIARRVAAGEVDIGVTVGAPADVSLRPTLQVDKLYDCIFEPLSLILPATHELAQKAQSVCLKDVVSLPFGLLTGNFVIRKIIRSFESKFNLRLQPLLQSDSFEVIRCFLLAEIGVTILPPYCVRKDISQGKLAAVSIDEIQDSYLSVHVIVKRDSDNFELLSRFVDCLRNEMAVFHETSQPLQSPNIVKISKDR